MALFCWCHTSRISIIVSLGFNFNFKLVLDSMVYMCSSCEMNRCVTAEWWWWLMMAMVMIVVMVTRWWFKKMIKMDCSSCCEGNGTKDMWCRGPLHDRLWGGTNVGEMEWNRYKGEMRMIGRRAVDRKMKGRTKWKGVVVRCLCTDDWRGGGVGVGVGGWWKGLGKNSISLPEKKKKKRLNTICAM